MRQRLCGVRIAVWPRFAAFCGSRNVAVRSRVRARDRCWSACEILHSLPVGRNLQDRGTAQAAMRDQHLLAKLLAAAGGDDFGGNSGEIAIAGTVVRVQHERHESGPRFAESSVRIAAPGRSRTKWRRSSEWTVRQSRRPELAREIRHRLARTNRIGPSRRRLRRIFVFRKMLTLAATAFFFEHGEDVARRAVAEKLAQGFLVIRDVDAFRPVR